MRANAFDRGARAKRRGKLLESNPFARRNGKANARRANDWALGWHSVEHIGGSRESLASFKWPPLGRIPRPAEGDYGVRMRGLDALFRPTDPIEWAVLREEMRIGVAAVIPGWAKVPYTILWFYASQQEGESIGEDPDWSDSESHPMKYLYSALRIQGSASRWPPLVVSAYSELTSD